MRQRIDALATDDGDYCVVCSRTGTRPVPVTGKRFPDRESAERATEAAATYRAALRRWDPRAPWYDFIACAVPAVSAGWDTPAGARPGSDGESLTGFCHDVAAAVLGTLSAEGHEGVESAVMDAYCESATVVDDPDDLCLHLLQTVAFELDVRLSAEEQRRLLRTAADDLARRRTGDSAVAATLDRLAEVGLLEDYTVEPTRCPGRGRRSWTVSVDGYRLAGPADALPTLPLAVDLLWRLPRAELSLADAVRTGERTWEFTLTVTDDGQSAGLLRAPTGGHA